MLGIWRTSATERVRRGEIPSVRLGRRLLVPKARLLAMLDVEPPAKTERDPPGRASDLVLAARTGFEPVPPP